MADARNPQERGYLIPAGRIHHARSQGRLCLLVFMHPVRGLVHRLVQPLTAELPGLYFTLSDDHPQVDSVWICGYEPGSENIIRHFRRRHPAAVVVVTRPGALDGWEVRARAAGADHALRWPCSYQRLGRMLMGSDPVVAG